MTLRHCFIAPELDGPITGGTLYNRQLITALRGAGVECSVLDPSRAAAALSEHPAAAFWLDSLFLSALPELERVAPGRVGVVLHYLPALLERGEALTVTELSAQEAFAVRHTERFLLPSPFMKRMLERLGTRTRRLLVIEPGRPAPAAASRERGNGVRALIVANLTPNKGVEPLLAALADELTSGDHFELDVVGALDADSGYARDCRRWLDQPVLRGRVRLLGSLTPEQVILRMAESNLLVSASRMESYGMVLAEARALGLPIAALRGGNAAVHVVLAAGGELAETDVELARVCVRLARDPAEHERRLAQAYRERLAPRPWSQAATEFLTQLSAAARGTTA